MKKLLTLIVVAIYAQLSFAQAPQGFSYQAIARDNAGNPKANTGVAVKFSILNGSAQGTAIYAETHQTQTNNFGLFNLTIGKGSAITGTFASIDWAGPKFLKVEIDGLLSNTTQLMSVPYALYAEKAGNAGGGGSSQWRDTTGLRKGVYYDGPILAGLKGAFTNDASIIIGQENADPNRNLIGLFTRRFNNRNTDLQLYAYPDESSVNPYLRGMTMLYSPSSNNGLQFTAANGVLRFTTGGFADASSERMRIDLNGNIGIGTSNPAAKVQVASGDVYIQDVNRGVIMKSPDGSCWRMTVSNAGAPVLTKVACPN